MTFALDLQKFAEKAGKRADELVGNVVIRIATEIDQRSPVGDATYWTSPPPKGYVGGRFRGNWQLGVGVIPNAELNRIDTAGTIALPAIIAEVPDDAAGRVFYLANNVPYARRLEDGYSRQAPNGIVGRTVVQFRQIVNEATEAMP